MLANKYSRSVIIRSRKQDFEMSRVDCNSFTFIPPTDLMYITYFHIMLSLISRVSICMLTCAKQVRP